MQTFYFTDPGKVRSHNEDSVTIVSNENKEFVLANGGDSFYRKSIVNE